MTTEDSQILGKTTACITTWSDGACINTWSDGACINTWSDGACTLFQSSSISAETE